MISNKKIKVLHCSTTDSHGGAAIAAMRLMDGLVANFVDAKMLVLQKNTNNPNVIKADDLRNRKMFYRIFRFLGRKIGYYYKSYQWLKYPNKKQIALDDVFISYLDDTLDRIDFDILHLHWVEGGFINFKEIQRINKPIVWTIHGSFPFTGICHHLICDKFKSICGNCPALNSDSSFDLSTINFNLKKNRYKNLNFTIISPSNFLANKAKESTLLGSKKIHVIHNCLNTELFNPINKPIAKNNLDVSKKLTILFGAVGATTDMNKGFHHLLEAIKKLELHYSKDSIQLLVFGGDFKNDTCFDIKNLGYISDPEKLSKLYSAADVMVVPSIHENLPYTIMESLSCGTPVVAFNIGGNSDLIDHQKNGFLAIPFDIDSLTEGIIWCLSNNTNNNLSLMARQKVLNKFSINKIVNQHIDLYKSLIENY